MTPFERAMRFVARWEGGFVDHPSDPGGRTNMGVTQKTYDWWRESKDLPVQDVLNLTDEERDQIYKGQYWVASGAYKMTWPLALVHFDSAVNLGVPRAKRLLGESAHWEDYLRRREEYYVALATRRPGLAVFLKGWLNRLKALRQEAEKPIES